ncbi:O-methyltransferase [Panus rudis PR-1116 ss-1]|nr:O-methyltransferase [Panus rudis PR-1116 ss-1]
MSALTDLLTIITDGVQSIDSTCRAENIQYPGLDGHLSNEAEAIRNKHVDQANLAIAAAYQLIATLSNPHAYLLSSVFGVHVTAALGVVEAANIAEILREAGQMGLHVDEIAAKSGLHPGKIGRILRFLATRHVFREVKPNIFTNNRISETLDTGKSVKILQASRDNKWQSITGVAAMVKHIADESTKSAAYFTETLLDPKTSHSMEPNKTSVQTAFGTDLSTIGWLTTPEQASRLKVLEGAMASLVNIYSPPHALTRFGWASLPEGSLVVDVGGGVGTASLALAKVHKHLRYIVQDHPKVIEHGLQIHRESKVEPVLDGTVRLQAHDFYGEQPVTNADVFFLRFVLHDWDDAHSTKILKRLRDAAKPSTKVVIMDNILDYAASEVERTSQQPSVPSPLLPNLGMANALAYHMDIQMAIFTNAFERTLDQFDKLFKQSGWRLETVHRFPPPVLPQLVASPA